MHEMKREHFRTAEGKKFAGSADIYHLFICHYNNNIKQTGIPQNNSKTKKNIKTIERGDLIS